MNSLLVKEKVVIISYRDEIINLRSAFISDGLVGSNSKSRNLHGIKQAAKTRVIRLRQGEDSFNRDSTGDISIVDEKDVDHSRFVLRLLVRIRQQPSAAKDKMFLFVKGFGQ